MFWVKKKISNAASDFKNLVIREINQTHNIYKADDNLKTVPKTVHRMHYRNIRIQKGAGLSWFKGLGML